MCLWSRYISRIRSYRTWNKGAVGSTGKSRIGYHWFLHRSWKLWRGFFVRVEIIMKFPLTIFTPHHEFSHKRRHIFTGPFFLNLITRLMGYFFVTLGQNRCGGWRRGWENRRLFSFRRVVSHLHGGVIIAALDWICLQTIGL